MNLKIKQKFIDLWNIGFTGCELPVTCFYSDCLNDVPFPKPPKSKAKGYTCIISQLAPVRKGRSRAFNRNNLGCSGALRPLGFDDKVTDDTKHYMCNVERVKKSISHLESMFKDRHFKKVPETYLIFKRWDTLEEHDDPKVIFFFGNPDMISGLHGLANFDTYDTNGMISPFATGCDSIVGIPMEEYHSKTPKAVLGALDPSVRTRFKSNQFTFAVPWPKFIHMLNHMDNSFLKTENWSHIQPRFKKK